MQLVTSKSLVLFTNAEFSECTPERLFQWVWKQIYEVLQDSTDLRGCLTRVLFDYIGGTEDELRKAIDQTRVELLDRVREMPQAATYVSTLSDKELTQRCLEKFIIQKQNHSKTSGSPLVAQELQSLKL